MSWFKKLLPSTIRTNTQTRKSIPEGLWAKCPNCDAVLFRAELDRNLDVCPKCDHHMRVSARRRLGLFLDPNSETELGIQYLPADTLKFKDTKRYKDRIVAAQKDTGETDALIAMQGTVHGLPVVACAFEFAFIGGSMGQVVGQRFVTAVNTAIKVNCPLVSFNMSGGARMQESLISLMQMAKTSAALTKLHARRLPYISVLLDPCTGGVSASFAMLGDLHIAEPRALIGFAGPRVIEQTVRETLPEGFQRSEFLLEHGAIDMIVHRKNLKATIANLITMLTHKPPIQEPRE